MHSPGSGVVGREVTQAAVGWGLLTRASCVAMFVEPSATVRINRPANLSFDDVPRLFELASPRCDSRLRAGDLLCR